MYIKRFPHQWGMFVDPTDSLMEIFIVANSILVTLYIASIELLAKH